VFNLPLIRKVLKVGNSFAITIPKSWITSFERNTNQKIIELALEVNGILKVFPVFEKKQNLSNELDLNG
jgi:antitoxin component of MazEF toxin-antitoxin module